jgi:hypothetical protein
MADLAGLGDMEMKFATIWKQRGGYVVEWRDTPDMSVQPVATRSERYLTRADAKKAVSESGAKLWN